LRSLDAQAAEEPQLHNLTLPRVDLRERLEGAIHGEHVERGLFGDE
jgi:hypothetical protein